MISFGYYKGDFLFFFYNISCRYIIIMWGIFNSVSIIYHLGIIWGIFYSFSIISYRYILYGGFFILI